MKRMVKAVFSKFLISKVFNIDGKMCLVLLQITLIKLNSSLSLVCSNSWPLRRCKATFKKNRSRCKRNKNVAKAQCKMFCRFCSGQGRLNAHLKIFGIYYSTYLIYVNANQDLLKIIFKNSFLYLFIPFKIIK